MLNTRSLLLLFFLFASPNLFANVLGDAWACAKATANSTYTLASKGAKAAQVLGENPMCIGYATAQDPAFLAITGTLFTLNALDSSLVSANHCEASVKSNAIRPLARLLNSILGGSIPPEFLADGATEAVDQLWSYLNNTPPFDQAISRVDCGCTFIEAGVSVENLLDILKTVAQAGEKCDAALANIPGYSQVKDGVQKGATELNNLAESIFTDQTQHKSLEEYYLHDFGGWPSGYELFSHAAAAAINPSHNWRTQDGALFYSQTWVKSGQGAANGNTRKDICVNYFDSHKMSNSNANKVCENMVVRFENEYKNMVKVLQQRDELIRKSLYQLSKLENAAVGQCKQLFNPTGLQAQKGIYGKYDYYDANTPEARTHNDCVSRLMKLTGRYEWSSPYDQVGSLGTPVDPNYIDQQLKAYKEMYFQTPLAAYGTAKVALDGFENNNNSAVKGVELAVAAYEIGRESIFSELNKVYEKRKQDAAQNKLQSLLAELGGAEKFCPSSSEENKLCMVALESATTQCAIQKGKVYIAKEFPSPEETAKLNAIDQACKNGYFALANEINKRYSSKKSLSNNLAYKCPNESGLKSNCLKNVDEIISACMGGDPQLTAGYFVSKTFAQNPLPLGSCAIATEFFTKKWGADDKWITQINSTYSSAAASCINKTPNPAECQTQLSTRADSCRQLISSNANLLLGNIAVQSSELDAALEKIDTLGKKCIAKMQSIPEKMAKGKEAEVLMLATYSQSCQRSEECVQSLKDTFASCRGLTTSPTKTSANPGANINLSKSMSSDLSAKLSKVTLSEMKYSSLNTYGLDDLDIGKTPEEILAECKSELDGVIKKYSTPQRGLDSVKPNVREVTKPAPNKINLSPTLESRSSSSRASR